MVIKVSNFSDLGKCSFGTLLGEFNTDTDHIYIQSVDTENFTFLDDAFVEVKINGIKDLCKFLWCNPFISTNNNYFFTNTKPWWHSEFNRSLTLYKEKVEQYRKRLTKATDPKRIEKIKKQILMYAELIKSVEVMINDYETTKIELTKKLIAENER